MQAREYPFLDSDVPGIFDDLLEANLIDLPEMKRPEEAERKDDPKYCKYHRLVGTQYKTVSCSRTRLCNWLARKEGGHEALAIDEKGFDPKAFKLLIKAGYDPKEKLSLGKLSPEATGLGFTPPKPVRITIKRVNSNYISEGFSSTEDHKREENSRESVFNRLGPHRKELHGIANRQSVFDSIVPVRKKNGQIRVCVDFRDLNNACPKDDFPLPIAELMIDATTGHEALSFMDGSSGYNQIRMAPADEELTAFLTPKGIYCYKVMPFGLKNARTTYQRAMQKIFDDMLHKNVECYVDDLVKLKHYFQSHSIHLVSKANPLKYVMAKPVLLDRLARWYLQLQQFEITYVPQKAVKGQVLADFLADHPMPAEWELSDDLPDEDVSRN
ncbi:UNVERIFIED_CONTAM: Transposon Tf2-12 polyprotein [Sesamum calycinum]|uniref:Transposon Tf2-12 polyprotein n=1 Tax=Sesamum calycinum TaxID=2727403 RepID=A0AAW2J7S6_9LAMI